MCAVKWPKIWASTCHKSKIGGSIVTDTFKNKVYPKFKRKNKTKLWNDLQYLWKLMCNVNTTCVIGTAIVMITNMRRVPFTHKMTIEPDLSHWWQTVQTSHSDIGSHTNYVENSKLGTSFSSQYSWEHQVHGIWNNIYIYMHVYICIYTRTQHLYHEVR